MDLQEEMEEAVLIKEKDHAPSRPTSRKVLKLARAVSAEFMGTLLLIFLVPQFQKKNRDHID